MHHINIVRSRHVSKAVGNEDYRFPLRQRMDFPHNVVLALHINIRGGFVKNHRLANVTASDNIYVMHAGNVAESGGHEELLARGGIYAKLWNTQQSLENYGKDGADI